MAGFSALAKKIESLADVPVEAVAAAAPRIRERILSAGRPDGALQRGNAAVIQVSVDGTSLTATRVGLYGPNPKALMSSVNDQIQAGFARRLA